MIMRIFSAFTACLLALPTCLFGQSQRLITIDLSKRALPDTLPFGEPFTLTGAVASQTDAVAVRYGDRTRAAPNDSIVRTLGCHVWVRDVPMDSSRSSQSNFSVDLPFSLRPNRIYLFEIKEYESPGRAGIALPPFDPAHPQSDCKRLNDLHTSHPTAVLLTDSFTIRGQTPTDYKSRFDNDIGVIRSGRFQYVGAVSDIHYYLVPINKNEDLADPNLSSSEQLLRRISLMGGLSVARLSSKADVSNVFGIGTPALGFGFRGPLYWPHFQIGGERLRGFFQPMRLTGGFVWVKQKDANPLVTDMHTKRDWFIGLTADVDLKSVLGPFSGFFGSK